MTTMGIIKQLFFLCVPKPRLSSREASILMYHSVSERGDYFSSVSPKDFARHLEYLASRRIEVVPLATLLQRLGAGAPLDAAVALTFDDGYEDNYSQAFPLLKKYGFPATIFLTTDLLGKEDKRGMKRLTEEQVKEMADSGLVRFEPHTKSHPHLSTLDAAAVRNEIDESRTVVQAIAGMPCTVFAYPYGDYTEETQRIVDALGFIAALSVQEGLLTAESDRFALPRNSIDSSTSFAQFRGKVSQAVKWYGIAKHRYA